MSAAMRGNLPALTRCHECRWALLDTFATFSGVTHRRPAYRATLSSFSNRDNHHRSFHRSAPSFPESTTTIPPPDPNEHYVSSQIPWYLRIPPPTPPTTLSLPSQQISSIPPLPANPPPILSPLLHYTYTTLGLDALTLLDLRHAHPSPALGSNLLMLLATARSAKHLNVSADRLCRWCRTNYKIRPYADGLLGRNELKIKLRRKMRRMKLKASAGGVDVGRGLGSDDGLTTGWVCVSLGEVPEAESGENLQPDTAAAESARRSPSSSSSSPLPPNESPEAAASTDPSSSGPQSQRKAQERPESDEEEYANPPRPREEFVYAGFGDVSTAPRVVVQMFTADKRVEMDLEGLWGNRFARERKREEMDGVGEMEMEMEMEMEVGAGERVEMGLAGRDGEAVGVLLPGASEDEVEGLRNGVVDVSLEHRGGRDEEGHVQAV